MVKSQLQSLGRKNEATKRLDNHTKDFQALRIAISKNPDSVADQQEAWSKASGKSRASFFVSSGRATDTYHEGEEHVGCSQPIPSLGVLR